MTMTSLIESRNSFSSNFAPVDSIDNLVEYQQAVPADIDISRDTFFINNGISESLSWNIQKAPYILRYLVAQSHTSEESLDKKLRAIVEDLNTIKDAFAHEYARKKFLAEALEELAELDDDAKEEDIEPPSPIAKKLARELLEKLTLESPREYAVSLWKNGDIVIYAFGSGWRVDIFCRANGGASLYLTSPLERGYQSHYQSAQDMSINTIIDALNKIPA